MRFQVPQFIEHETKVVGPFSLKQSFYLFGPLVIDFFLWFTLPFIFFVIAALLLQAAGVALIFVKIGNKSLPELMWDAVFYFVSPQGYIWKKKGQNISIRQGGEYENPLQDVPPEANPASRGSKLHNLALRVDTKK